MSTTTLSQQWYALYVAGGTEDKVKSILKQQMPEFEFLVYRRKLRERKDGKWQMIERKMFPGYILMKGIIDEEAWYRLKKTQMLLSKY